MSAADLLLVNTRIREGATLSTPMGILVRDGEIREIGDPRALRTAARAGTDALDLHGAVTTAGLVDGHLHPALGVEDTDGVDLTGCRTLEDVRAALARETGEWIVGWGLDPNCFGDRPVTNAPLADVFGDRPAVLRLFDAHSALLSEEALRRAGIDGPREFADRSAFACDESGRPTGLVLEFSALEVAYAPVPRQPFARRRERLRELLEAMAATGLTGGHVMDCNGDALELYRSLDEAGELPLRLRIAPWCRPGDDSARRAELVARQGAGGRLWEVAGVKMFLDGTIDNSTAWLAEPDCCGHSRDSAWRDPAAYSDAVRYFAARGIQTATHAIGDAAVAHALSTMATLPPGSRRRHRIEHIETIPDELIPLFARYDVVASMQPAHATEFTRADRSDNWSRRIGEERAGRGWRCRDLLDAGATLVLGSDWPVAPFDPRPILAAAQLRRAPGRPDAEPVGPAQALTAQQALHGYTAAPAAAIGDRRGGAVAVGMRADLTVWADDPVGCGPDALAELPIRLTMTDGLLSFAE